jgi:hypothetical protein
MHVNENAPQGRLLADVNEFIGRLMTKGFRTLSSRRLLPSDP